jgi:hypothetical protein
LIAVGTGGELRSAVIAFYLSIEGVYMLENAAALGLACTGQAEISSRKLHGKEDDALPVTMMRTQEITVNQPGQPEN